MIIRVIRVIRIIRVIRLVRIIRVIRIIQRKIKLSNRINYREMSGCIRAIT